MITSDLSTRLSGLSLITTGFSVYRNYQPDNPNKIVALMEVAGFGVDFFFNESDPVEMPSIQVVVRGESGDGDTPRTQIERIYQSMSSWGAWTATDGTRYIETTPLQPPFLLKRDANERVYWVFNVLLRKEQSTVS